MTGIKDRYLRGMFISVMVIAISAFNFMSLEGKENFRSIHILTLLICGMGIGVLLTNFLSWIKSRKKPKTS